VQKKHDEPTLHEEESASETFLMEGHRYMEKHITGTLKVSDQYSRYDSFIDLEYWRAIH
jgi:hypothetical protein